MHISGAATLLEFFSGLAAARIIATYLVSTKIRQMLHRLAAYIQPLATFTPKTRSRRAIYGFLLPLDLYDKLNLSRIS
jgi:hypothetical protein